MTVSPEVIERMAIKSEIADVLYRYCHACDRSDIEMLKSVYHPGAIDNHGLFDGPADEYAEFIIPRMEQRYASTQHHMTNILVDIHGDTAYVEAYFISFHRWREDFGRDSSTAGRYVDRFEKRDGRWLIAHRQLVIDWTADHSGIKPTEVASQFMWGARRDDDYSRVRLPEHSG